MLHVNNNHKSELVKKQVEVVGYVILTKFALEKVEVKVQTVINKKSPCLWILWIN